MAGYYKLSSWIGNLEVASRGEEVRSALLDLLSTLNNELDNNPSDRIRIGHLANYFNSGLNYHYPNLGDFHLMVLDGTSKNTVQCGTIWPLIGSIDWFALTYSSWLPDFVDKSPPKGVKIGAEHLSTD